MQVDRIKFYPYVPQRVAQKRDFAVFASKIQLRRRKSAVKFLCVKTSRGKVMGHHFDPVSNGP